MTNTAAAARGHDQRRSSSRGAREDGYGEGGQMNEQKWFRMQDGPPLPWELGLAIYRTLYEPNYSQSAETIHERGGGGYDEIKALAKRHYDREQGKVGR